MHVLINLLLAILAGGLSLYVLRSMAKTLNDGLRVLIAVLIALIVFFANLAQYILTNQ